MWWLRSQLIIDQEFLADRFAARRYGTSSSYAASLLSLADHRPAPKSRPAEFGAALRLETKSAAQSPLSQRVLMLLYCPFRFEARAPRSWSWALRITLSIATLTAACLCIRWPDASALEHRLRHEIAHSTPPFRVTDFTAEPLLFSTGGRALSYVMPVALPSQFELTVEVYSSSAALGKVRIAGHALGLPPGSEQKSDSAQKLSIDEAWHPVRLRRNGSSVSLWVDGQPIPVITRPQATTEWLTFEPDPERATQFRLLVVEW
jgi:hypothetical protein